MYGLTCNAFASSQFRAKVSDFGLSAKKTVGATGTPAWMAPELLRNECSNTAASDVYSFGIILYEVFSRKEPYEGENLRNSLKEVADPLINKRPPVPSNMPSQLANIMEECISSNPDSRPSFEEIEMHIKRLGAENVEPASVEARGSLRASKSENLLYKVFPKDVADALRDGRKVEPEDKECVTMFFSDIGMNE